MTSILIKPKYENSTTSTRQWMLSVREKKSKILKTVKNKKILKQAIMDWWEEGYSLKEWKEFWGDQAGIEWLLAWDIPLNDIIVDKKIKKTLYQVDWTDFKAFQDLMKWTNDHPESAESQSFWSVTERPIISNKNVELWYNMAKVLCMPKSHEWHHEKIQSNPVDLWGENNRLNWVAYLDYSFTWQSCGGVNKVNADQEGVEIFFKENQQIFSLPSVQKNLRNEFIYFNFFNFLDKELKKVKPTKQAELEILMNKCLTVALSNDSEELLNLLMKKPHENNDVRLELMIYPLFLKALDLNALNCTKNLAHQLSKKDKRLLVVLSEFYHEFNVLYQLSRSPLMLSWSKKNVSKEITGKIEDVFFQMIGIYQEIYQDCWKDPLIVKNKMTELVLNSFPRTKKETINSLKEYWAFKIQLQPAENTNASEPLDSSISNPPMPVKRYRL